MNHTIFIPNRAASVVHQLAKVLADVRRGRIRFTALSAVFLWLGPIGWAAPWMGHLTIRDKQIWPGGRSGTCRDWAVNEWHSKQDTLAAALSEFKSLEAKADEFGCNVFLNVTFNLP